MRTGDGRDVNRHNFSREEVRAATRRHVVQRLERLIRLRNAHPAFDGEFDVGLTSKERLRMTWSTGAQACTLDVDFRSFRSHVGLTDPRGLRETFDL